MCFILLFFFFKQKTAYDMRISDWSSDVCSSDLPTPTPACPDPLNSSLLATTCSTRMQNNGGVGQQSDLARQSGQGSRNQDVPERRQDREFQHRHQRKMEKIGRASCRERGCQ